MFWQCGERNTPLGGLFQKSLTAVYNHEKTSEGHSTKYLISTFQECQRYFKKKEEKEKPGNSHRLEESKETWQLNAT